MTPLEKTLKRELSIDGRAFIVAISPDGIKLTLKGKRNGQELQWKDLVSGDAALAVALNASLGGFARPAGERAGASQGPAPPSVLQPAASQPPAIKPPVSKPAASKSTVLQPAASQSTAIRAPVSKPAASKLRAVKPPAVPRVSAKRAAKQAPVRRSKLRK